MMGKFHSDFFLNSPSEIQNFAKQLSQALSSLLEVIDSGQGLGAHWPREPGPFIANATPERFLAVLKSNAKNPLALLESLVEQKNAAEQRAAAEKEAALKAAAERTRLQAAQKEAALKAAAEQANLEAARKRESEAARKKAAEEAGRVRAQKEHGERLLALKKELGGFGPFAFDEDTLDLSSENTKRRVIDVVNSYKNSPHGWVYSSGLISKVTVSLNEKGPQSLTKITQQEKAAPAVHFMIGEDAIKQEIAREIENTARTIESIYLTRENSGLKVTALTQFLKQYYAVKMTHMRSDPRPKFQMKIAKCLDAIYEAIRMLTPEEKRRLSELNFYTPDENIALQFLNRVGSVLEKPDGDIDPTFYDSPESIAKDIRENLASLKSKSLSK